MDGQSSTGNIYSTSALKTTETNVYNALPSILKSAFKQFNAKTAEHGSATSVTNYPVYMCSPAEKEVFGTRTSSVQAEANALTQFDYFKTSGNRVKKSNNSNSSWWLRSPETGGTASACYVTNTGTVSTDFFYGSSSTFGVSPFGCI